MNRLCRSTILCLIVGFIAFVLVSATHAQVTTADLEGRVTTTEGDPLGGIQILAREREVGIVRETTTAAGGRYRLPALRPGTYDVTAIAVGYVAELKKDITLEIGQVAVLDFQLSPHVELHDVVEVVGRVPLVQTTESIVTVVVNEAEIENLPLNSRDPVELALLSPGVTAFRAGTPAFSPLNFGANNNRSTRVFVDGIDLSSDALGGIFPPGDGVSLNTVEQFEVAPGQFKAEYGLTNGGVVNLITKSGTNEFHGVVFGLFRDDALNSSFVDPEPPFERQQFGLSFGGPLAENRNHFFLAVERNQQDDFATVNTAGAFPELEGTFPIPQRITNFMANADHQWSSNQSFTIKYAFGELRRTEGIGGISAQSSGLDLTGSLHNFLLYHKWIASDRWLSEMRLGYVKSDFNIDPVDSGPHLIYPSVETGRFPGGRQRLDEDRWQLRGDVSYFDPDENGEHNWKLGFDLSRVVTTEAFDSLSTGLFVFGSDQAPLPFLAVIGAGDPNFGSIRNYKAGLYVQDDWSVSETLTFNLGLRYDVETNATNQDYFSSKTDPDLPFIVKGNRSIDQNNFAPRIGFAWDPFHKRDTVVRGNYGIYYGRVPSDFPTGEIRSDQYRFYTIFGPGTTNVEEIDLSGRPYQIEWLLPEKVPIPYTRKLSFGVSRQFTENYALDVDYIGSRGYNEYFARHDVNPLNPETFSRPLPQYQEVFVLRTDGRSIYDALEIVFRSRLNERYQFRALYTLSKAENDSDEPHFAGQLFKRGPAGWDERHRFIFDGIVNLPLDFTLSGILTLASGRPFNVFTGNDENLNGDLNDDQPPETGRNSERGDGYSNVDVRVTKSIGVKEFRFDLVLDVFNLFNRRNFDPGSYVGNLNSPNFGQPTAFLAARQVQLGAKFSF